MNKKFIVRLSEEERVVCQEIIKNFKGSSQKFRRAQVLLKADADGPGWSDVRIAEAFNCRVQTIENLRKRLVLEGFELALDGKRVDYEYERNGTASIFMFAEPLSGFRQATARVRRTKADWAIEVAQMLDTRYADREEVTLVCDNLNTHTKGAFYEAFEPDRARGYIRRINFCYTPKHGSWLNVAECELSCLTSQCLSDRRIGELTELQTEIAAWSEKTNAKQRGVDWQFRIENARIKLKRLYPKIKD
jgi:hypothetical protein